MWYNKALGRNSPKKNKNIKFEPFQEHLPGGRLSTFPAHLSGTPPQEGRVKTEIVLKDDLLISKNVMKVPSLEGVSAGRGGNYKNKKAETKVPAQKG